MTRVGAVRLLLALAVVAFVGVLWLVNDSGHQVFGGRVETEDGFRDSTARVECASVVAGNARHENSEAWAPQSVEKDEVAEDDGHTLSQHGIDAEEVGVVCGRVRTHTLLLAGGAALVGLAALGGVGLVVLSGRHAALVAQLDDARRRAEAEVRRREAVDRTPD